MSSLTLPEYYGDFAQTTVAVGGYTAASGVLNVASTSGMGNGSQQFHFTIYDATTAQPKAAGYVTASNSGTQWAVTMTLDANANYLDLVVISLSAGAMNQIRADISQFGPLSGLPSIAKAGDRYKQTDGPYDFIYSGSTWNAFWNGYPVTLPPSSGWTSEGIASESGSSAGLVHYTNGFGYMVGNSYNAVSVASNYRTAPSTPYTITVRFSVDPSSIIPSIVYGVGAGFSTIAGFAVGFRDSGGKYLVLEMNSNSGTPGSTQLGVLYFTDDKTYNTAAFAVSNTLMIGMLPNRDLVFRIGNDGTNLTFAISLDGQNFYIVHSETITSHLANATSVCWGTVKDDGSAAVCLYDWTQGT